jgi:ankyrin repeat protein
MSASKLLTAARAGCWQEVVSQLNELAAGDESVHAAWDERDHTVLHMACESLSQSACVAVRLLLNKHGASPLITTTPWIETSLLLAARSGAMENVRLLLDTDDGIVAMSVCDAYARTPLHWAVVRCHVGVARYLWVHGANVPMGLARSVGGDSARLAASLRNASLKWRCIRAAAAHRLLGEARRAFPAALFEPFAVELFDKKAARNQSTTASGTTSEAALPRFSDVNPFQVKMRNATASGVTEPHETVVNETRQTVDNVNPFNDNETRQTFDNVNPFEATRKRTRKRSREEEEEDDDDDKGDDGDEKKQRLN